MRSLLSALLLLAGCAPVPSSHPTGSSGLTAEEEAALDNAVDFLAEDSEGGTPLSEEELGYPDARGMPADVQRFMVRWQGCQHWLGEPDWDAARRRQIEQAVREACPGIDAEGRRIRTLHASHPEVLARLRDYEPLGQ